MRGPKIDRTMRARSLRQDDNDAEAVMWEAVRARRLNGFKFVRQHPVGPYFVDFACREAHLVVELDGSQHVGSQSDPIRDLFMANIGWSIVRFWSADFLANQNACLETLVAILDGRIAEPIDAPDVRFIPGKVTQN